MDIQAGPATGERTEVAFDDQVLRSLRSRQREIMELLPEDVRDPLMPFVEGTAPREDAVVFERALRERVDLIIGEDAQLRSYLERSRRTRFAQLRRTVIERRYLELAGDAPAGMDEELAVAVAEIDPTVASPSYEEITSLARIVPLMGWADHFAG